MFLRPCTVSPSGSVRAQPSVANTRPGDRVELYCLADGGPGNEFIWTTNGAIVTSYPSFILNVHNTLVGGFYQCQVENEAGITTDTLTINGKAYDTCSNEMHAYCLYACSGSSVGDRTRGCSRVQIWKNDCAVL